MFKELLKLATKNESVKWFVLCFSTVSLGVAFFFLHTIIESQVRASLSYSVLNFIFFFLVGVAGLITFYLNSDLYTRYFFYVLVVHCLINLVCLFVGIYTIHPDPEVRNLISNEIQKFTEDPTENSTRLLDAWHLSLACCGVTNSDEFIVPPKREKNLYLLPLSCCEELDQDRKCSPKIAYQQGCWAAFRNKVKKYRIVTFILLALTTVLQILLIVAYSRTVDESEK